MPPTLQQVTIDPRLHQRLLDTHGQIWVCLLWGHYSFPLGPGVHKVLFVPSKSLFPQSCVSSGSSMEGLMTTSSRRAYAISDMLHPESLPLWQATACLYLHRRLSKTVLAQSLWGLWVLLCTRFVWALWASLLSNEFDSKRDFAPTFCWGFCFSPGCEVSFCGWSQHSSFDSCSAVSCSFEILTGKDEHVHILLLRHLLPQMHLVERSRCLLAHLSLAVTWSGDGEATASGAAAALRGRRQWHQEGALV